MLAGQPPFDGSPREVRQRHLTEAPPPLPREVAPEPVARAVARVLAKSPADRFDTAGAFAEALHAGAGRARPRARRRLWRAAGAAAVVAAVALAATELRSRGPVVVPEASRIAVLPFDPVTTDSVLARVGEDVAATVNVTLDRLGGITTVDRFATLTRTAAGRRSARSRTRWRWDGASARGAS